MIILATEFTFPSSLLVPPSTSCPGLESWFSGEGVQNGCDVLYSPGLQSITARGLSGWRRYWSSAIVLNVSKSSLSFKENEKRSAKKLKTSVISLQNYKTFLFRLLSVSQK